MQKKPIRRIISLFILAAILLGTLPVSLAAEQEDVIETPSEISTAPSVYSASGGVVEVARGKRVTLSTSGISGTITWTSAKPSVATVDSSGVVTGVQMGAETTVTASVNGVVARTYTVRVLVPDGVYWIGSAIEDMYMSAESNSISSGVAAELHSLYSGQPNNLLQMWKIKYLGNSLYSIRPMHKLDMALHAGMDWATLQTAGTNDASVAASFRWTITVGAGGHAIKDGDAVLTYPENGSNDTPLIMDMYSEDDPYDHWTLIEVPFPPSTVVFFDAHENALCMTPVRYVAPGETLTLSELGLSAAVVNASNLTQNVTWSASDPSVVSVNASSGAITGMQPGAMTEIYATQDGTNIQNKYTIHVLPIPDGTYFIKNKGSQKHVDIENQTMAAGTIIHQWEYHGGNTQKWLFTHLGDGTYSIKSANSTAAYYLGVSGDSTADHAAIVLRTGTLTEGMKWIINITDSGSYKLIPKTGVANNRVMALAPHSVNEDGIHIQQRNLTNSGALYLYTDEWHIFSQIDIGFSTDNYTAGCGNGARGSYHYANTFYDELLFSPGGGPITKTHHYNMGSTWTASKSDFSVNGAISNNIDFMIYIGHGHAAHDANGNHLHYDCGRLETPHTSYCTVAGNLYTKEVRFGASTSDLRWVWLYTCNFLTTGQYVTDDSLKNMMNGAHIVMGYASQSYLCETMAFKFAEYLRSGETIIRANFMAGYEGEAAATEDHHIQKILYIPQAEHETIYSPRVHYEYNPSDVLIYTHDIQVGYT